MMKSLNSPAHVDSLTGLPTWAGLVALLPPAASGRMAVAILDFDRFSRLNLVLGPDATDRVLKGLARQALDVFSSFATVARCGSDEFIVHCQRDAPALEQCLVEYASWVSSLSLGDQAPGWLTVSWGLAYSTADGAGLDMLVALAEGKLAVEKARRRSR